MKKENFLIPANSKRGLLILNIFTSIDAILFGSGVFITVFLVIALPPIGLIDTVLVLLPALIAGLLVTPIPNYHNVLVVLTEAYLFYSQRQKYIWKGWAFYGEYEKEENSKV